MHFPWSLSAATYQIINLTHFYSDALFQIKKLDTDFLGPYEYAPFQLIGRYYNVSIIKYAPFQLIGGYYNVSIIKYVPFQLIGGYYNVFIIKYIKIIIARAKLHDCHNVNKQLLCCGRGIAFATAPYAFDMISHGRVESSRLYKM